MCVIYACADKLPPVDELARGAERNDDGGGLAYRKAGKIHWKKGFKDEKDLLQYIADEKIPFPLAIHFRTASAGGVSNGLCHPFPIAEGAPLDIAGKAEEVLFHNGHITEWEALVLRAGLAAPDPIPEGDWSDSRALAWLTYLKGHGVLRFIHQSSRILVFGAEPYWKEDFEGDPWIYFAFWGSWYGKQEDGWKQSTLTEYYNRGGKGYVTRGAMDAWGMEPDDSTPACGVTTTVTAQPARLHPANVWTLSELTQILADMERELIDARAAARV